MYHSHFNEFQQITSGLYGPLIVVEPGQKFDPEFDRVLMFSDAGPTANVITGPFPPQMLNGETHPAPLQFRAGKQYRLRIIGITGDVPIEMRLASGDTPIEWLALARDGMTLPRQQQIVRKADMVFDPGQIFDFQFSPHSAGALTLRFGMPKLVSPPGYTQTEVPVVVR